ncbi:hypothetical protein NOV72_01129 [Caballeronia novacaledonica]|uniref:Lipoprotein n=1 Tax=Caballeronia novacaledonica TaxID=1544861 RepID=A0A2U3I1C3_9BURK|nr:hypothetical protein [Caballeronia novacaledonica]SPB13864.1 hypothetical protein NOV72_01129 [Caballeronia novacaledonica]
MFLFKCGHGAALCLSFALACGTVCALAATPRAGQAASAVEAASGISMQGIMSADALPPNFTGDDPEHVRDALAGHPAPGQPASITNRVRAFLSRPFRKPQGASAPAGASQPPGQTDRTFTFVIPVSYGVRYLSKKKVLSVNVSLAAPENPDAILLKQTVKGQSGRKLVVAPEAKEKGFVQTVDVIQLKPESGLKTTVSGRVMLPRFDHERGNGDFAIVLICSLAPPYLTDDIEHSAPTDEEPTDITRRTSTLNGRVDAAWLIDSKEGTIITKRLHLVK